MWSRKDNVIMTQLFSLDFKKDSKLIGKTYTLKGKGENGIDLKGKLIDINLDGTYKFKITTKETELDEFWTKVPNDGDIE